MGFTVPNAVELATLNEKLTLPWTLRLFGNNFIPVGTMTTAAFTEIAGGGYANKPITFANWTITGGDTPKGVYNATQIWTFTGVINAPGTIYGYYATRNSDNTVMLAERFSPALVPFVPEAGSQVRVLLTYTVVSQF
jgi:hypothetical protein